MGVGASVAIPAGGVAGCAAARVRARARATARIVRSVLVMSVLLFVRRRRGRWSLLREECLSGEACGFYSCDVAAPPPAVSSLLR